MYCYVGTGCVLLGTGCVLLGTSDVLFINPSSSNVLLVPLFHTFGSLKELRK